MKKEIKIKLILIALVLCFSVVAIMAYQEKISITGNSIFGLSGRNLEANILSGEACGNQTETINLTQNKCLTVADCVGFIDYTGAEGGWFPYKCVTTAYAASISAPIVHTGSPWGPFACQCESNECTTVRYS